MMIMTALALAFTWTDAAVFVLFFALGYIVSRLRRKTRDK